MEVSVTRPTKIRAAVVTLLLIAITSGIVMVSIHGCAEPPTLTGRLRPSDERSRHLMRLAAEEASLISDVDTRLTRLLNFADMQIQKKWLDEARATLNAARKALGSDDAKQLNEHARISGWVSVSELSRQAGDNPGALSACDGAVDAMRSLDDPARRCDYVMGICNELQYLKGMPAAAALLAEAGPWTKEIDDIPRRRQAVVAFASALFNLDDFTRGQQMLRQEDDPTWRSETLTQLASLSVAEHTAPTIDLAAAVAGNEMEESPPAGAQQFQAYFGKQLNYRNVYQGQKNSRTEKD
jgi:hypothetical protein